MAKRSKSERRAGAPRSEAPGDETTTLPEAAELSERHTKKSSRVTRELPSIEFAEAADSPIEASAAEVTKTPDSQPARAFGLDRDALDDEFDEGATREAPAISAPPASMASDDPDATVVRATLPSPSAVTDEAPSALPAQETPAQETPAQETPTSRPRYNTLAGAFNRQRPTPPPSEPVNQPQPDVYMAGETSEIADEVDPEDEWSMADQPTILLAPEELQALKPSFLDTGEHSSWPPRPQAAPSTPQPYSQPPTQPRSAPQTPARSDERDPRDWRSGLPPRPQPPFPLDGMGRQAPQGERLAAPDGRAAQVTPEEGVAPDFRMERFQELRRHRVAHEQGEAATDDVTPVADAVRQWWHDLRPDVGNALRFQREARASGTHPLPAYAPPAPTSRLGDAFGRLAASAREVTGRAQQVAAPAFKRIHDQMEQAAQGIIQRFEGDAARQQAPLLGPGRLAVFFRKGVTVGQAQRLLAASSARPMRLIPRRHGILAQVMPGREAEIGERLRQHPYVEDTIYMEYDEREEPRDSGH